MRTDRIVFTTLLLLMTMGDSAGAQDGFPAPPVEFQISDWPTPLMPETEKATLALEAHVGCNSGDNVQKPTIVRFAVAAAPEWATTTLSNVSQPRTFDPQRCSDAAYRETFVTQLAVVANRSAPAGQTGIVSVHLTVEKQDVQDRRTYGPFEATTIITPAFFPMVEYVVGRYVVMVGPGDGFYTSIMAYNYGNAPMIIETTIIHPPENRLPSVVPPPLQSIDWEPGREDVHGQVLDIEGDTPKGYHHGLYSFDVNLRARYAGEDLRDQAVDERTISFSVEVRPDVSDLPAPGVPFSLAALAAASFGFALRRARKT